MPNLTKTAFLRYLQCPRYMWLHEHRKEKVHKPLDLGSEWLIEEGKAVEELARTLFPDGRHVKAFHERGAQLTKAYVEEGATCIFQATAMADGLLAMVDILRFDPARNAWDILEVKGATQVRDDHLHDVAFQRLAFERAGYTIGNTSVIHINKEYVRHGTVDPAAFLMVEEVTSTASTLIPAVTEMVVDAQELLKRTSEPTTAELPCLCSPKTCPCPEHCFPDLPPHSVFYLRGITAKKARDLYMRGIRTVTDIPDGTKLNKTQQLQVRAAKEGQPIIDRAAIKKTLDALAYPLFFFDYETFSAAIPPFEGFKPNLTMPFQYSLHILRSADGALEHCEHLAPSFGNTMPGIIAALRRDFGEEGTIIAWNKCFEIGCNKGMAAHHPSDAPFLHAINERMFDLMEIFSKQHYVDVRFNGSCSIKKVLPVLIPSLSYQDLDIHEGVTASLSWYRMFGPEKTDEEREQTRSHLLAYCKLDTLAMVEIFRKLQEIAATPSP